MIFNSYRKGISSKRWIQSIMARRRHRAEVSLRWVPGRCGHLWAKHREEVLDGRKPHPSFAKGEKESCERGMGGESRHADCAARVWADQVKERDESQASASSAPPYVLETEAGPQVCRLRSRNLRSA